MTCISFAIYVAIFFSLNILFLSGMWVLLGLFINPTKVAPFAAGIGGLIGHIVSTRASLTARYNMIALRVRIGIAAYRNSLNALALKRFDSSRQHTALVVSAEGQTADSPEDIRKKLDEWTRSVFPDDITEEEVRALLSHRGINMRRFLIALVSSTVVIVFVLIFSFFRVRELFIPRVLLIGVLMAIL